MPKETVKDLEIYYHIQGRGEPLVMIQGVTMDCSYWINQIPVLSEQYRLIVLDNRGVGLTGTSEPPYTTAQMADDLAGLLTALEIPSAHVLGFALGGCVAQHFALKYPVRVKSLILAATSACPAVEAPRSMYIGSRLQKLADLGIDAETRTSMMVPWVLTPKFFEDPVNVKMVVKLTQAVTRQQTIKGLAGQIDAGLSHDTRKDLGEIKAPTLVLVAKEDLILPVQLSEGLAAAIPGAELKVLPRVGHLSFYEEPDLFNQAVMEFVDKQV